METAAFTLSIISLLASVISPVIIATAYFIEHIKHSECCMGKLDMDSDNNKTINLPPPQTSITK